MYQSIIELEKERWMKQNGWRGSTSNNVRVKIIE